MPWAGVSKPLMNQDAATNSLRACSQAPPAVESRYEERDLATAAEVNSHVIGVEHLVDTIGRNAEADASRLQPERCSTQIGIVHRADAAQIDPDDALRER
jgi:hypothetical protein